MSLDNLREVLGEIINRLDEVQKALGRLELREYKAIRADERERCAKLLEKAQCYGEAELIRQGRDGP